jgi:hypothetical protein
MRGCVCVYVCLCVCMRVGACETLVTYATHETYETRLFFPSQTQISDGFLCLCGYVRVVFCLALV